MKSKLADSLKEKDVKVEDAVKPDSSVQVKLEVPEAEAEVEPEKKEAEVVEQDP